MNVIYTPTVSSTSIPIIDLNGTFGPDSKASIDAAQAIYRACRETGFFYVANHGIKESFVSAQFSAAKQLFDLPIEMKMRIHMKLSPTAAGYEPIGGQTLDSQDADTEKAPPDLKESFYCGAELADDHPVALRQWRGLGHNQWPELPGFRDQTLSYHMADEAIPRRPYPCSPRSFTRYAGELVRPFLRMGRSYAALYQVSAAVGNRPLLTK